MRKLTDWLRGYCSITLCGGSPQWCLNRFTNANLPFWDIVWKDEFTVSVCIYRKELETAKKLASGAMCQIEQVWLRGAKSEFRGLKRRCCLLVMLFLSVFGALAVPRFIWFYEVEGNSAVPAERIIRQVQTCGVKIGTYGKSIRPSLVKEAVLSRIPELSWLTVTQSGGRAKIVVREKKLPLTVEDRRRPQNVVAAQSGMVTDISVLEGAAAVKKGDMVQKGQLLISGYMDLEYKYRICGAMGEVYARTWRDIYAVTPEKCVKKSYSGREKCISYLCIGRKRIKLSLGSGILPTGCDKMTETNVLTLPGGLKLPVALVHERYRLYDAFDAAVSQKDAEQMLLQQAVEQTDTAMVAGRIEEESHRVCKEKDNYTMHTTLQCVEMISRTREAEIFKGEFTHDGTSN